MSKENPLARWRREHELTQEDVAALLGVRGMTVSRWERGSTLPHRKIWPKIREKTGITPADLVDGAA
jgi:transcriptional regulator with XRE-family HTH domain